MMYKDFYQLPKLNVVGSSPITRFQRHHPVRLLYPTLCWDAID
ncbi:hypothetical protein [Leptolyngbya sp. O-77]|nr:hypothetical protein [Leptolyngbya sp. O-77]